MVFLVALSLPTRNALAEEPSQAKDLYNKATAHYAVGEYEEAAEAYQSAYKLKPDAALLYNAAQSYRLAGKHERALTIYRNYLRLYPKVTNAETVQGHITKLEERIAAEGAAKTRPAPVESPTSSPVLTSPPPPESFTPPPAVAAPTVSLTAGPDNADDRPRPIYKKPWFWGVVGGAVAVGVITAIVVSSSGSTSWENVPEIRQAGLGAAVAQW